MPVYLFVSEDKDPRTGAVLAPLPPGHFEKFVMYFPGRPEDAIMYVKQQRIGSWHLRPYKCYPCTHEHPQPIMLAVQRIAPPVINAQHVHGGQPTGAPIGTTQNRQDGERDGLGFVQHGDGAFGKSQDGGVFSDVPDEMGTYTDLFDGGKTEVPRQ